MISFPTVQRSSEKALVKMEGITNLKILSNTRVMAPKVARMISLLLKSGLRKVKGWKNSRNRKMPRLTDKIDRKLIFRLSLNRYFLLSDFNMSASGKLIKILREANRCLLKAG